jgi:putative two-component system response regulator
LGGLATLLRSRHRVTGRNGSLSQPPSLINILVADDDAAIRALLRATLERAGYGVLEAVDGLDALGQVKQHAPDLVLLDVNMPELSGIEVTRRIRESRSNSVLPIIRVTAMAQVDDKIEGLDAGATDFVTKPFDPAELQARVRACLRTQAALSRLENVQDVLVSLATAVEAKDPTTEHHCSRLAHAAVAVARSLALSEEMIEAIGYGAVLHDIGKIGIAETILQKERDLTEEEWVEMRKHPTIGATIIEPLQIGRLAAPIVRHHHERWDGKGYPNGLRGEAIPIGARIVSVADAFDAMTHDRPYRTALSLGDAIEQLISGRGRQFDGDVVTLFVDKYLVQPITRPGDALTAYTHGLYQAVAG